IRLRRQHVRRGPARARPAERGALPRLGAGQWRVPKQDRIRRRAQRLSAEHKSMGASTQKQGGRRAIIVGGSMSGLFTAAFLRQIGWDADVYERSPVELVGRGAGITSHPELLEALEASGAGTADLGIEVPKRMAIDRDGRITGERPLRQVLTSWDRLQRLLRGTIDEAHYHLGYAFERVDQDER